MTKLITIAECVEYGVDRDKLIRCLEESARTVNEQVQDWVYVGLKNKSRLEPDGSDWGKVIKRLGAPVTLGRAKGKLGVVGFYEQSTGIRWETVNGNVTITPQHARDMLRDQ